MTLRRDAPIEYPLLNKATAFTEQERIDPGLPGVLPPHIESPKEPVERTYEALQQKTADSEKHINLRGLQDTNETLFYALPHTQISQIIPQLLHFFPNKAHHESRQDCQLTDFTGT